MRNDPWESLALGPDQAYTFAPDMAAELGALLVEVVEQATGPATLTQRRTVLLRQLALMDRLCEAGGGPLGASQLKLAAARLVDFDRQHDTGWGHIPTDDRAWELDPVGYVRQEYAQLLDNVGPDLLQRGVQHGRCERCSSIVLYDETSGCPECGYFWPGGEPD